MTKRITIPDLYQKSVLCIGLDADVNKIPHSLVNKYGTTAIEIFNKK